MQRLCPSHGSPDRGSRGITRWLRSLLRGVAGLLLIVTQVCNAHGQQLSGPALPGLDAFDQAMVELMSKWQVPGASLALARDGRLVLSRGYGLADRDRATAVTPNTRFRMASINKTLTAVAILKLVEAGKLSLDAPALPMLAQLALLPATLADARVARITVRHLLEHSAGFDRFASGDPFFGSLLHEVSRRQRSAPLRCEDVIKDVLERRLDFAPGQRHVYSNVGYCMLGKLLEAASGESYATYVSRELLQSVIGRDYLAGKSLDSGIDESHYYPYAGEPLVPAAPGFSAPRGLPSSYGSFSIESMEALGAWVATTQDVLKFFLAIDGSRGERLLSESSVRLMREAPAWFRATPGAPQNYYGLGVHVFRHAEGDNWWHDGSQPGVQTLAVRAANGYAWVVAFNLRPGRPDRGRFFSDIDSSLWRAARSVQHWPDGDLFER